MNATSQPQTNTPDIPAGEEPKAPRSRRVAAPKATVPPSRHKTGKKTTAAQKAAHGARRGRRAQTATAGRSGTKTAQVLELLRRPGGATLAELQRATGWQPHSFRGFLSGADPATLCTPLLRR